MESIKIRQEEIFVMPNINWIPEIMYEETSEEEGLSSNIPFIPVPNNQEMPKLIYIFE